MPHAKKKILTVTEITEYCGCNEYKVRRYIARHNILPYSLTVRGSRKDVRQYELTSDMEEYLRTPTEPRGEAKNDPAKEAKRIADGWFTIQEIADKWNCSYMKTLDILVTSHAEWQWEGGKGHEYQGRKLWKIPDKLSRDPTSHKQSHTTKGNDWTATFPEGDGDEVKAMVMDERKWKQTIGKRVMAQMQTSGVVRIGKLVAYNMICFSIKDDRGVVHTYKTREAQVVKELEV